MKNQYDDLKKELIDFAKEQYVINMKNDTAPKISEQDAKKHDILMANTKAHFASYEEVKQAHPGDIVLFQRGDFFEMYGPDARVASVELDIHLTNRNIPELGRVAMCGVPAGSLDKSVEILRKKYGITVSALPEKGTERQTYSLPSFDSELDNAKKLIQDFCQQEYGSDADFSDLEHVSLAYTTTEDGGQEIQVEADLVHFVLTKYLDSQVCDEYHYNSLKELTEAELSGMTFDELVTLEVDVQSITPRYRVTAYHPTENGCDAKLDYQTQAEAEKIARDYVAGRMDEDGFQYEGATVLTCRSVNGSMSRGISRCWMVRNCLICPTNWTINRQKHSRTSRPLSGSCMKNIRQR